MAARTRRRARVLVAAGAGVAVVGSGLGWALVGSASRPVAPPAAPASATAVGTPSASGTPRPAAPPPARPALRKGEPTDPLTGGRRSSAEVFAVKIENIAAARPQVGLAAADVVVVEEVEAGLTRLVAIYHSEFPRRVGPVRSARNTDVQLLPLFGRPGLVYSGANRRVQRNLDRASVVPLPRSTRDPSRAAPHNVVVDLAEIARRQRVGRAQPIGWTFAADDPRWRRAAREHTVTSDVGADRLTFAYQGGNYLIRWRGQTYGQGDRAARTDNVVVLSVRNRRDGNADVTGAPSVLSETVGRGKLTLHRDGRRLSGTWSRPTLSAPMRFRDSEGRDLPLAPGKTWLLLRG